MNLKDTSLEALYTTKMNLLIEKEKVLENMRRYVPIVGNSIVFRLQLNGIGDALNTIDHIIAGITESQTRETNTN